MFRTVPADLVVSGNLTGKYTLTGTYMQSPDFVHGVSGWAIFGDGSAEFNNLAIRGIFTGTDFVIEAAGEFYYSGTPAAGNLVSSSVTNAGGFDSFGNAYLPGYTSYTNLGGGVFVANSLSSTNQLSYWTAASSAGPWTQIGSIAADVNSDLTISANNRIGLAANAVAAPGGTFEGWHTLGGLGTTGYTISQGRFRYEAIGPGYTVIEVQLQAGAGGGTAGVYTWTITLPAAYQFPGTISKSEPLGFNGTSGAGANAGSVLIDPSGSATPGRVRLDIPGLPANTIIGGTVWLPQS